VMSGFGAYVAAITVRSTVKNRPACGAEQMSPARGLAPMFGNFLCGHVITTRAFLWLREEVGLLGPVAQRTVERPSEPFPDAPGCPMPTLEAETLGDGGCVGYARTRAPLPSGPCRPCPNRSLLAARVKRTEVDGLCLLPAALPGPRRRRRPRGPTNAF
jgi:hypothetical protein